MSVVNSLLAATERGRRIDMERIMTTATALPQSIETRRRDMTTSSDHKAGKFFEPLTFDKNRCQNCGGPFMFHTNGTCPDREPKSQYNMEGATLVDAANHLAWLLGHMANRLHNATAPASIGEQKADAAILMDEAQPLISALKELNCYRPDGTVAHDAAALRRHRAVQSGGG